MSKRQRKELNKVEIFKNYFRNLWESKQYNKVHIFRHFVEDYYCRKGQRTEYAYIFYAGLGFIESIDELTDGMIDAA